MMLGSLHIGETGTLPNVAVGNVTTTKDHLGTLVHQDLCEDLMNGPTWHHWANRCLRCALSFGKLSFDERPFVDVSFSETS